MTSSLDALIAAVATILGNVAGIRKAEDYPPEAVYVDPVAIIYPDSGLEKFGPPGVRKDLFNLVVEVLVPRKDLPKDVKKLTALHDDVFDGLMQDQTLGGTVQTFDSIEWTFGPSVWDVDTVGYRLVIRNIKKETTM